MNAKYISTDKPARYRLCLQGRLSVDWSDWLIDALIIYQDECTWIDGMVHDQAALFGLLSFVRNLGVPLLLVEFVPESIQNGESK